MDADENTGASPEEPADPLVMSEALAARLAAALRISDPKKAEYLCTQIAKVREWYVAVAIEVPPRLLPADAARQLERLARFLEHGRKASRRALDHHGARWLLRAASFEIEGTWQAAEQLIGKGDYERALPIVRAAIARAHGHKAEELARPQESAVTTAVRMAGEDYTNITDSSPTRGGKDGPSPFEFFLEVALGDLTEDKALP